MVHMDRLVIVVAVQRGRELNKHRISRQDFGSRMWIFAFFVVSLSVFCLRVFRGSFVFFIDRKKNI